MGLRLGLCPGLGPRVGLRVRVRPGHYVAYARTRTRTRVRAHYLVVVVRVARIVSAEARKIQRPGGAEAPRPRILLALRRKCSLLNGGN